MSLRVLFTIPFPYGLGADRWVYWGYKRAFEAEGHEFYIYTEKDNFKELVERIKPNILFIDGEVLNLLDLPLGTFASLKEKRIKVICQTNIGLDREDNDKIENIRNRTRYVDILFTNCAPEMAQKLEDIYGRKVISLPHAADSEVYYPEKPHSQFAFDIAFVGSAYTQKGPQFQTLLIPLVKKYRVGLYGPGWTIKDKMAHFWGGIARKAGFQGLAALINKQRITISQDDERKLYASAKICVNLHEYYKDGYSKNFPIEREFKIPASGGFQISDYCKGMENYFDLKKEIAIAANPAEWFGKIDYYLRHEKERKEIQEAGTKKIMNNHTYRHRVKQIIELLEI